MSTDSIDLEALAAQEQHYFKTFSCDTAFKLGLKAREIAETEFPSRPAVIDITLTTGATLFRTVLNEIQPDNEEWVKMKRNTVIRFNASSYRFGQRFKKLGRTLKDKALDPTVYTVYGGGFPIRVEGSKDFITAVITVSGLKDHEDHYIGQKAVELTSKQE